MRAYEAWSVVIDSDPFATRVRSEAKTPRVDVSEPVSRIMSVPARAARKARELGETPRAWAVPVSESVIVTPLKPSPPRSNVVEIACDQPAALTPSYTE